MRIALATCRDLPDWEIDDRPLHAAFAARGVELAHPVWNDPTVDWSSFAAVLIRTTWDYQEHREEFVAWAERVAGRTRLFNPPGVVRWNTHKSYLRELADLGAPLAPTVWLEAGAQVTIRQILEYYPWERAFIKPLVGATARETLRFRADEEGLARAQAHLERLLPHEALMIQPYLPGIEEEGELSAVYFDGEFSHGVRKIPVPGDYRAQDDFGASDEPWSFGPDELDLADGVLRLAERRFGRLLYARIDFLRGPDGDLLLNEFEAVEPSLFFRHAPEAAGRLADALLGRLAAAGATP
ncbi:MAG: hypothetical protein D6702_01720 [Planctomycetota bacterium]|nr:MAG: hypothetical protein D6702_01720 [Planctomycetota bacterium]